MTIQIKINGTVARAKGSNGKIYLSQSVFDIRHFFSNEIPYNYSDNLPPITIEFNNENIAFSIDELQAILEEAISDWNCKLKDVQFVKSLPVPAHGIILGEPMPLTIDAKDIWLASVTSAVNDSSQSFLYIPDNSTLSKVASNNIATYKDYFPKDMSNKDILKIYFKFGAIHEQGHLLGLAHWSNAYESDVRSITLDQISYNPEVDPPNIMAKTLGLYLLGLHTFVKTTRPTDPYIKYSDIQVDEVSAKTVNMITSCNDHMPTIPTLVNELQRRGY